MNRIKSWQLGPPGTLSYRLYDLLRQQLNRSLVRHLTSFVSKTSPWRFLEAGSGSAFASSLLAQVPSVVLSVAIDMDLEALKQAQLRDPSLPIIVADLEHLPFASGSFTMVWNNSTLEHLTNHYSAIKEMSRVTQSGGTVFIGVPYSYGPLGFQKWIANTSIGIWIGDVFDRNALIQLVTNYGLIPKSFIYYYFRFFIGIVAEKSID